ncbi:MAG: hypothetical protein IPJ77_08545 [Planctomycetes bacterium]|nr:hypothetical protein [Planctomycetota bacterium]
MTTLPIRIVDAPLAERVISVDGSWPQPGLNLSHWPGNTTPRELKHDLSTGIALAFAKLPRARQAELAQGCVALANNHYDTDGACALFAVAHPEAALARAGALLDAAAAGDLFRFPSERAFAIDCVVNGFADLERSPLRARFAGLDDRARRELATNEIVRLLPELLDGALEPFAELWKAPLERCLADRRDLAAAARDDLVHLDLAVWTAPMDRRSSTAGTTAFDPGRHALFGSTEADRVLVLGPGARGTTARFLVNTTSWFELVTRTTQPRPDLAALAARLNALEGTTDEGELAWRAQPSNSPSPELWFGGRLHPFFAEHAAALAPSRLDAVAIRAEVVEALRAVWVFPDDG